MKTESDVGARPMAAISRLPESCLLLRCRYFCRWTSSMLIPISQSNYRILFLSSNFGFRVAIPGLFSTTCDCSDFSPLTPDPEVHVPRLTDIALPISLPSHRPHSLFSIPSTTSSSPADHHSLLTPARSPSLISIVLMTYHRS